MLEGDVLADRYELEEQVGSGGMSTVFRAHDRVLERKVAIKILHQRYNDTDEYVQRFRREAQMAATLQHPNIVTVIDRGEEGGRQYIVFEYIDGDNLKEVVSREGPMTVERVLTLGIQIGTALAFAHHNGLVHRDVKPQNVLLNGNGTAKVTDFGIARSLDVGKGVTQTGTVLGTSDYIAPEQAQGQSVGERTDVYSLGIVLYELLTGQLPFAGDNFVAIAMKHINEVAPRVSASRPDVPQRLDDAIAVALAKDPDARFAQMDDFRRELQTCLAEVRGGTAVPVETDGPVTVVIPPSAKPPRARRRSPWGVLLLVLALAILAGAIWFGVQAFDGGDSNGGGGGGGGGSPSGTSVSLAGVTAYDPQGDDKVENNAKAPLATDGNQATYWPTARYYDAPRFGVKDGVGLVLDAGSAKKVASITVTSDTPGFNATIMAGDSASGPFHDVSTSRTIESATRFDLADADARYYVIWITTLPDSGSAHVNEVTARS